MKAFVTGATGLLGNNLVRALRAEGHDVRALVRSAEKARTYLGDTGAEIVQGDMEDVGAFVHALEGCDVVFHTAAYFREYYSAGDHWPKLEAINVHGTMALAQAARTHGVRRFVDVSSSGTIGLKPDGSPGDENTPPAPLARDNLYLKSKVVVMEKLVPFAASTGLDVVQVLPGWMFGPWDAAPTAAGQLVRDFLSGALPAIPPGGTSVVDARDVATGMIRAAERGRSGERYILAGGFATLADIIETLARTTGVRGPRMRIPYPVAWTYAAVSQTWAKMTGGQTLVTLAGVRMMQARLAVDSSKSERELGFHARPLEETLRDEVAWYRAHTPHGAEPQSALLEASATRRKSTSHP
ncbi:SDR family oxidoreductase [Pendulispora brunnea]|uniref:SDR family oxidoreductase n=1 Tax=Pendulispora brunnea TaxID=2905690 RepID=A0ABZ2K136_9BACT